LNLDSFGITETEKEELKKTASEIANMPVINIPKSNRLEEFSEEDKRNIERLDYIFWKRTPQMTVGRILNEVNPIGGYEKANAVKNITKKLGVDLADTMYVGDSITDVEAFRLVREGSGLTVSFNGNNYAVREAEIGVTSPDTSAIEFIAGTFIQEGKEDLLDELKRFPRIETITQENMEEFSKHSSKFRKTVRGEAVGKLG
jgi:predicted HAD superfamily phosphohydrolase